MDTDERRRSKATSRKDAKIAKKIHGGATSVAQTPWLDEAAITENGYVLSESFYLNHIA